MFCEMNQYIDEREVQRIHSKCDQQRADGRRKRRKADQVIVVRERTENTFRCES